LRWGILKKKRWRSRDLDLSK